MSTKLKDGGKNIYYVVYAMNLRKVLHYTFIDSQPPVCNSTLPNLQKQKITPAKLDQNTGKR